MPQCCWQNDYKAHSKSPWGAGLVHTGIGSDDCLRLVQHNLNTCTCIEQNYTALLLSAFKLASELHAHSVKFAHKLVTTRHAIENKNTPHSQALGPGTSSNPPDPH
eukprot:1152132-Pelagomonas_calceolata.AAC.3